MTTATIAIKGYPTQIDFVEADNKFCLFVGGVGSGKTWAGAQKAALYVAEHPGANLMVTAPTYRMLMTPNGTLDTYRKVLGPLVESYIGGAPVGPALRLRTGGIISFRSTENPDHLRGASVAGAHMDEAAMSPYEAYAILLGRLRQEGYPLRAWFTTTPRGFNWLYDEFVSNPKEDGKVFHASTRENRHAPIEYIETMEGKYKHKSKEFAMQEIEGQFVIVAAGGVFDVTALGDLRKLTRKPIEERENGLVKIYGLPMVGRHYVSACDVALGVGGDSSCFGVMAVDSQSSEIVAIVHSNLIKTDEFAYLCDKLSREYFNCLVCPEANSMGEGVVRKLVELKTNLYYSDEAKKRPGWTTGEHNKYFMVDELEEAIRGRALRIPDRETVEEFYSFVRDEKGKVGAHEGAHDDRVMMCALLWQMRKHGGRGGRAYKSTSFMRER